jgi:hypothetical protein
MVRVGLLGATPKADVERAATALAAGDIEMAFASAVNAEAAWTGAPQVGRSRIVSAVLLLVALVLLVGLIRQRRRRRPVPAQAEG